MIPVGTNADGYHMIAVSAIRKWRYTFCFFGRGRSVGKCLLLIRSMPCGMWVTHVGRRISPPWFGPAVRTGRHVRAEGKHSCVLSRRENSSQIRGAPNSTGTERPRHLSLPNAVFLPDKSPQLINTTPTPLTTQLPSFIYYPSPVPKPLA